MTSIAKNYYSKLLRKSYKQYTFEWAIEEVRGIKIFLEANEKQ
jgi:hypothetical protein